MVECNIFDIKIELIEDKKRKIFWELYTDLPCGTEVSLSFDRTYLDYDNEKCLWTLFDDCIVVERTDRGDFNGANGRLMIDKGDENALKDFNEELGSFSSGIKSPVTDELIISFVVGARQPLKAFGKNNCNLNGGQVVSSGGINVVNVSRVLNVPIKSKYQPIHKWR